MLRTENATKSYDSNVFSDLNIDFPNEGFFVIFGESGCGKSTLLNILSGLESLDSGKVFFNDKELKNEDDFTSFRARHVSFLFQDYGLEEHYSIKRNMLFPEMVLSEKSSDARIKEVLSMVGINKNVNTLCSSLSGGEKQRVALARILLHPKDVIICDEPTCSLDNDNAILVFDMLKKLSSDHLVIVVSHDEDTTMKYADYIYDFRKKKVMVKKEVTHCEEKKRRRICEMSLYNKISLTIASLDVHKGRTLLSLVSFVFVTVFLILSISLSFSLSSSLENATKRYLDYNKVEVSYEESSSIGDTSFSFVKSSRPEKEDLDDTLQGYHYKLSYSLDYLFSSAMVYQDNELLSVTFRPVDFLNYTSYSAYYPLMKDMGTDDVFINSAAEELINGEIRMELSQSILTYDDNFSRAYDNFSLSEELNILGTVDEFSFMSIPVIYYSNQAYIRYLKSIKIPNASLLYKKNLTYYDRFSYMSSNDEELSSYCYDLYLEEDEVLKVKSMLEEEGYSVTSYALENAENIFSIMDSVENILLVFVILSFVIVLFLVGIILYSFVIDRKREIGLLEVMGVRRGDIMEMFITEGIMLSLVAGTASMVLAEFSLPYINQLIEYYLDIPSLLKMPSLTIYGYQGGFTFLYYVFMVFAGIITGFVPAYFASKIKIASILRGE